MDVRAVFLNGDLEDAIFMRQPKGCEDKNHPDCVGKLEKGLYGTKQASRKWNEKIGSFFFDNGYKR